MIQIFDLNFDSQEKLNLFKKDLKEELGDNYEEEPYNLFCSFLDDMLKRSNILQDSIQNNISNDLVSCVNLPWDFGDDFDKISFSFTSKSGRKVKKREELMFKSYCDKYFGEVVGLFSLFESRFP